MKKLIALLVALVMLLTFAACGEATQPTEEATQPTEETVQLVEVEGLLSEKGAYREYTYSDHVLNDQGQVISRKVKGDSNRTDTFEYDEQGRLIKNTRASYYGEEIWTYTYDENGLLVEEFQGDRTFKNTYTVDDQNRILTKTMVNTDGGYTMVYSYTYNEDGTVATETQKSPNSTYVITFTYDNQGRVIKEVAVKEGESSGSTTYYTYGVVGSYTPAS